MFDHFKQPHFIYYTRVTFSPNFMRTIGVYAAIRLRFHVLLGPVFTTILHPHRKVVILPSLSSLRLALSSLSLLTTYLTCIVPWWLSGSVTGYKVDCSESVPAKPSDSLLMPEKFGMSL